MSSHWKLESEFGNKQNRFTQHSITLQENEAPKLNRLGSDYLTFNRRISTCLDQQDFPIFILRKAVRHDASS